jgi:hypothetical protein
MTSQRSATRFGLLVIFGIFVLTLCLTAADTLPDTLSDTEFWSLIERTSEPDGYFRSNSGSTDNLLSNENGVSNAATALSMRPKGSGVYLGVGPEQNLTYIAAMHPRIAFITDIRRGNMLLHLMYKALFETSANRADFVSRLFNRQRLAGDTFYNLTTRSTARELMSSYLRAEPNDDATFNANLKSITDHLTRTHGFPLSPADLDGIKYVYENFRRFGPAINYTSSINRGGFGAASYASLMATTDGTGTERSYLASEDSFTFVKNMESHNLIVPVVGDFAGPKALRAVGSFLKGHGVTVTAFYVSNVEDYLQRNGVWLKFCANVAALPLDSDSVFIRLNGGRSGLFARIAAETEGCAAKEGK